MEESRLAFSCRVSHKMWEFWLVLIFNEAVISFLGDSIEWRRWKLHEGRLHRLWKVEGRSLLILFAKRYSECSLSWYSVLASTFSVLKGSFGSLL